MMRLGSMLQHPAQGLTSAELAPSPLPSGSPLLTSPPGGQPFRLRSPTRMAARAIPPAPTPPSSFSIPQKAIQGEVERQLQGVMGQLREFGEANQRLQHLGSLSCVLWTLVCSLRPRMQLVKLRGPRSCVDISLRYLGVNAGTSAPTPTVCNLSIKRQDPASACDVEQKVIVNVNAQLEGHPPRQSQQRQRMALPTSHRGR